MREGEPPNPAPEADPGKEKASSAPETKAASACGAKAEPSPSFGALDPACCESPPLTIPGEKKNFCVSFPPTRLIRRCSRRCQSRTQTRARRFEPQCPLEPRVRVRDIEKQGENSNYYSPRAPPDPGDGSPVPTTTSSFTAPAPCPSVLTSASASPGSMNMPP